MTIWYMLGDDAGDHIAGPESPFGRELREHRLVKIEYRYDVAEIGGPLGETYRLIFRGDVDWVAAEPAGRVFYVSLDVSIDGTLLEVRLRVGDIGAPVADAEEIGEPIQVSLQGRERASSTTLARVALARMAERIRSALDAIPE